MSWTSSPAQSDWQQAWAQGRWSLDLCDAAWNQADKQPSAANLYLALTVQHALSGLQPHHLNYTQELVNDLKDPWQAVTLRLLCARLQYRQFEQAQQILHRTLTGPVTLRRSGLLIRFPLALSFILEQQPQRLHGKLVPLAHSAQELQRSLRQISPEFIKSLNPHPSETCRVAVVGNARHLLDNEEGALIDEHDVVVRFNAASMASRYRQYTGQRTDLWVISPALSRWQRSLPARALAISGINPFAGKSHYWQNLHKRGIQSLLQFNEQHWYALVNELGAPPSAGLLMLRSVTHKATGLDVNAFGFTRPEHLTYQVAGSHYSDRRSGSSRHNWPAEAYWFSRMIVG